jgi:hypothetical protein
MAESPVFRSVLFALTGTADQWASPKRRAFDGNQNRNRKEHGLNPLQT